MSEEIRAALEQMQRTLADLIPPGEAVIYSREGYSVVQVEELQGYKRIYEASPLARGECWHYHGGGLRCQCGAVSNVEVGAGR